MPALPHAPQGAIERSLVNNRAAVARKIGLTRAQATQFVDLLLLAPDLQARVLGLEAVDGAEPRASERSGPSHTREAGPTSGGCRRRSDIALHTAPLPLFPTPPVLLYRLLGRRVPMKQLAMTKPWSSVDDVAKYVGVAQDSIYRWIEVGGRRAHKIGRLWKLKLSEVDRWDRAGSVEGYSGVAWNAKPQTKWGHS